MIQQLKQNINKMFQFFLPILKEKSKMAAVLTEGLSLNEASRITSNPISSISWGREQIENKNPIFIKNIQHEDTSNELNEEKFETFC